MRNLASLLFLASIACMMSCTPPPPAPEIPPLVYEVENTGADCPKPVIPSFDELPEVATLPDPFMKSDGSGRDTTFAAWKCRRAEIKAEIEHFEIGMKPVKPDTIQAAYTPADSLLTIHIIRNGDTLTMASKIRLPEGEGPFPALIGVVPFPGVPVVSSLPNEIFTARNIALIEFRYWEVMVHQQKRGEEPINKLYPELAHMGAYSAWSWGVSRLIDGLELVAADLPIDLKHLTFSGCSFAGKMALFGGAFDERIALTIAQESGGGGAPAWRVSKTLGKVETLCATDHHWFMESMFEYCEHEEKLPYDHHELMAMVAPRALLITGNTDYEWLANPSTYVSARAAQKVYKTLGIGDRFGFAIDGGYRHCLIPDQQRPILEAFVDKFLLGKTEVSTDSVEVHPYGDMDYEKWIEW